MKLTGEVFANGVLTNGVLTKRCTNKTHSFPKVIVQCGMVRKFNPQCVQLVFRNSLVAEVNVCLLTYTEVFLTVKSVHCHSRILHIQ